MSIKHNPQIIANGAIYTQVRHSLDSPLALSIARSIRDQSTHNLHVRALVRRESSGYTVYANKVIRRYAMN